MEERIKKLIKPLIIIAAVIFIICYLVRKPSSISDVGSYLGYSISGVSILFLLYERWLWRYIPWNRPYVLKKKYSGKIEYIYNNEHKEKVISVLTKQTWHSISIQVTTDINRSSSITADIIDENHGTVLYYTYMTNPTMMSQVNNNPIQHGACRMDLASNDSMIRGVYWTSHKTAGDIMWFEEQEEHDQHRRFRF